MWSAWEVISSGIIGDYSAVMDSAYIALVKYQPRACTTAQDDPRTEELVVRTSGLPFLEKDSVNRTELDIFRLQPLVDSLSKGSRTYNSLRRSVLTFSMVFI